MGIEVAPAESVGLNRFIFIFLFLASPLGISSQRIVAAELEWTPSRLLKVIETLEQVGIDRRHHDRLAPILDSRLLELSRIATESFQKETGIPVVDKPSTLGWSNREMSDWIQALRSRTPQERCNLIRLAYAVAISRLSIMKPSVLEPPSFPVSDSERNSPAFAQDVERALWEFRYFWVLKDGSSWTPTSCADFMFPKFSVTHEARTRMEFLESGVNEGNRHFQRWPVGRAKKMCGRPFHTHYVDHLTLDSSERQVDPEPQSLRAIQDPEVFERRIQELEKKALRDL